MSPSTPSAARRPTSPAATDGVVAWRVRRGWSHAAIAAHLRAVDPARRNFDASAPELGREDGWNQVRSEALVGREAPGPPAPGGAFERARALVERFEFSDPRIVVWHFDARTPLRGRVVLLEMRPLALRFLCPVVVAAVRDERGAERTTFALAVETLDGHIERGREWFLLEKDHASGEVRFRIRAAWQTGQFPGWWAWLGFQVLGRRYQRAWHRLAHRRMRALVALGLEPGAVPRRVVHAGVDVPTEPVQFFSFRAAAPAGLGLEREEERPGGDRLLAAAGVAAAAGAAALLVRRRRRRTGGGLIGAAIRAARAGWS